jgi:hypothetical protein
MIRPDLLSRYAEMYSYSGCNLLSISGKLESAHEDQAFETLRMAAMGV